MSIHNLSQGVGREENRVAISLTMRDIAGQHTSNDSWWVRSTYNIPQIGWWVGCLVGCLHFSQILKIDFDYLVFGEGEGGICCNLDVKASPDKYTIEHQTVESMMWVGDFFIFSMILDQFCVHSKCELHNHNPEYPLTSKMDGPRLRRWYESIRLNILIKFGRFDQNKSLESIH